MVGIDKDAHSEQQWPIITEIIRNHKLDVRTGVTRQWGNRIALGILGSLTGIGSMQEKHCLKAHLEVTVHITMKCSCGPVV